VFTQSALSADSARKKRRRTTAIAALALVVVTALGVGGGLLYAAQGSTPAHAGPGAAAQAPDEIRETVEKPPRTPQGALVADIAEDHLEKNVDDPRYAPGTWATDKIFAKGVAKQIMGYRLDSYGGEEAWTVKLDGHLCATTGHVTADGRTAVVVQPSKPEGSKTAGVCDEVLFLDLDTGKKLWRAKLPEAATAYVTNTNLTMTRGTVAVGWGRGSVAYGMADGEQLWKSTKVSRCEDAGFAGGRGLLALVRCGEAPDAKYQVEKLDPRTGRTRWTYQVGAGITTVYLPSSDPPVLAVGAGDSTVTDLITLDGRGKHLATVSLHGDRYDAMCGSRYSGSLLFGVVEACDGMVVGRTEVFVASKDEWKPDQEENWITGFDLATGKALRKFDGREGAPVHPLRMSGDQLLIYRGSRDGIAPAAVLSVDPDTGKETPFLLFNLPESDPGDDDLGNPEESDIIVEHGRVYFAKRQLYADDKYPKYPVRVALGIGSGT
jgi:outer membrane protein assembly factor BamB